MRRLAGLSVLFLCMAVLGSGVAYFLSNAAPAVVESDDDPTSRVRHRSRSAYTNRPRQSPVTELPAQERAPYWSDEASGSETTDAASVTIRVECRNPQGEPVPGIAFRCVVQAPAETIGSDQWFADTFSRVAGQDGSFEVRSTQTHLLTLEPQTQHWYCATIRTTFKKSDTMVVTLRPVATVKIRIQYEDGSPFSGSATIGGLGVWSRAGGDIYLRFFRCDGNGLAEMAGVPVDQPLQCVIMSDLKVGYEGYEDQVVRFEPHELTSGRELLMVIARTQDPLGKLRVEFQDSMPGPDSTYVLECEIGLVGSGRFSIGMNSYWLSGGLEPMKYRFTLLGPFAWQSTWLEVSAGRETVVQADLQPSGKIQARLVDSKVDPLKRAILRVPDGSYVNWSKGRPRLGVEAEGWSNEDGVVTLAGLPPGKFTLTAEARGKEPMILEVEVVAEGTTDIGDVVLADAMGEVTVEITGRRDGVEYAIVVFQPSGGPVLPFQDVIGDTGVVKGLPLRKYRVTVTGKKGGSLVGEYLTLTPEHPSQTIRIDVSSVKPD